MQALPGEFAGSQFSLPFSITRRAARNQTPALQMCQFQLTLYLGTRDRAQGAGKSSPRSSPGPPLGETLLLKFPIPGQLSVHSFNTLTLGVSAELHISLWEQLCGPWGWRGDQGNRCDILGDRRELLRASNEGTSGPVGKTLCSQCRGPGLNPWSGNNKILNAATKSSHATVKDPACCSED